MKRFKKFTCMGLSVTTLLFTSLMNIPSDVYSEDYIDKAALLGDYDADNLLGTSSMFSIFIQNTFAANGSDCEGRIAAGTAANISANTGYYSVNTNNQNGPEASVIIGTDQIMNFDLGRRKFAVNSQNTAEENYRKNAANPMSNADIYDIDLIDFNSEFSYLSGVNSSISNNYTAANGEMQNGNIILKGENEEVNIFKIDGSLLNDMKLLDIRVPNDSYVIINVENANSQQDLELSTHQWGGSFNGTMINGNHDPKSKRILWNIHPSYEKFHFNNSNGTFYGSILAPKASYYDNMQYGAHLAGGMICKSFNGGIEIGDLTYDGDKIRDPQDTPIVTTAVTTSKPVQTSTETSVVTTSPIDTSVTTTAMPTEETSIITTTSTDTSVTTTIINETTQVKTLILAESITKTTTAAVTSTEEQPEITETTVSETNNENKVTSITTTNNNSSIAVKPYQSSPKTRDKGIPKSTFAIMIISAITAAIPMYKKIRRN